MFGNRVSRGGSRGRDQGALALPLEEEAPLFGPIPNLATGAKNRKKATESQKNVKFSTESRKQTPCNPPIGTRVVDFECDSGLR